jgi:hypothetical protein
MRRVILESPYAGDVERNVAYARKCLRDSLLRGEAPFASHLIYTQPGILNDDDPTQRRIGMEAGFFWLQVCDASAVYTDFGISRGMLQGIERARQLGIPIEYRSIYKEITS